MCICIVMNNCSSRMNNSSLSDSYLRNTKISNATIAVYPVDAMDFRPGQLGKENATPSREFKCRFLSLWNKQIKSYLTEAFESIHWVFLNADSEAGSLNGLNFSAVKRVSRNLSTANTYNSVRPPEDSRRLSATDTMKKNLNILANEKNADYALVFVSAVISGESSSNMSFDGNINYSSTNTASIRLLLWECASGKLLFSSKVSYTSSMTVLPVPTEPLAVSGACDEMRKQLKKILKSRGRRNKSDDIF